VAKISRLDGKRYRQGGESEKFRMRVIVLGGAGNFGARIIRALRGDPTIDLLVAGRRSIFVPGAEDVAWAVVDIGAPDFSQQSRALSPQLLIHCGGPFQGQDYRVANAVPCSRGALSRLGGWAAVHRRVCCAGKRSSS
jgi:hypothetical protein